MLAEGTDWFPMIIILIIMTVIAIVFAGILTEVIKGDRNGSNILGLIVTGIIVLSIATVLYTANLKDEFKYYKVKINDFNVLHEQDYEIISQEGNIYKIRKDTRSD